MNRSIAWIVSSVLAGVISGCTGLLPPRTPIPVIAYNAVKNTNSQRLVVFLPGRADSAADFKTRGMLKAFRQIDSTTDVIAVQAHMGYYAKREVATRIYEDVLLPAIAAGKTEITLVGISLGGLGGLIIEQQYPGVVVRRVLIAPFVGNKKLIDEITNAGSAANRQPQTYRTGDALLGELWTWLKANDGVGATGSTWLLLGHNDRYIAGQELLATLLEPQQTLRVDGKHNWKVWLPLWNKWLSQHWNQSSNDSDIGLNRSAESINDFAVKPGTP